MSKIPLKLKKPKTTRNIFGFKKWSPKIKLVNKGSKLIDDPLEVTREIVDLRKQFDNLKQYQLKQNEKLNAVLKNLDVTENEIAIALKGGAKKIDDLLAKKPKFKKMTTHFWKNRKKYAIIGFTTGVLSTVGITLTQFLIESANAQSGCFKQFTDEHGQLVTCKIQEFSCCSASNNANIVLCNDTFYQNYLDVCNNWTEKNDIDCCNGKCFKPSEDKDENSVYVCREKTLSDAFIDFAENTMKQATSSLTNVLKSFFIPMLLVIGYGVLLFIIGFLIYFFGKKILFNFLSKKTTQMYKANDEKNF